jgi:RNA polymerase sigma factor (sigma-70 family)
MPRHAVEKERGVTQILGRMLMNVSTDTQLGLDVATAIFIGVRPRLSQIAYRMLGSANDIEDVVQETWMRWQRTDRAAVRNPAAFLSTTTSRLAMNAAMSTRVQREQYTDPVLLEPVNPGSVNSAQMPEVAVEHNQDIEAAATLMLQVLTASELAAYVLREAFDYSHSRIAELLEIRQDNVRQLVSRARQRIAAARPGCESVRDATGQDLGRVPVREARVRRSVTATELDRFIRTLRSAASTGNLAPLECLLCEGARH